MALAPPQHPPGVSWPLMTRLSQKHIFALCSFICMGGGGGGEVGGGGGDALRGTAIRDASPHPDLRKYKHGGKKSKLADPDIPDLKEHVLRATEPLASRNPVRNAKALR